MHVVEREREEKRREEKRREEKRREEKRREEKGGYRVVVVGGRTAAGVLCHSVRRNQRGIYRNKGFGFVVIVIFCCCCCCCCEEDGGLH